AYSLGGHDTPKTFRAFQDGLPSRLPKSAIRPLLNFVETWDQPEREFLEPELQDALKSFYAAAQNMAMNVAQRTVPVGNMEFLSVFSDAQRAVGPRPDSVIEDARILNEEARKFVPLYEHFLRLCRSKLAG
ncbi:hypothetical protein SB764_37740, partial [Paraburkholderia sp. SIMBA_027]